MDDRKDIVLIADPRVLAVPADDCGEPLVPLAGLHSRVRTSEGVVVRRGVAARLVRAVADLPDGLRIFVYEGYRSLATQREYFDDYVRELESVHPDWDADALMREASKYVAPPDSKPPHSTGAAVDLTIESVSGDALDMGTAMNEEPDECGEACFTEAVNISQDAVENRRILIDVLTSAGFINYPTEWWHWSYGDRYWAFVSGEFVATYDSVDG